METRRILYIMSASLMIVGAAIYILFREPVIFTSLFVGHDVLYPIVPLPHNVLCDIVRYTVPDALWCGAMLLYATAAECYIVRLIAAILPIILEFGQALGVVPGTFDIIDLTVYLLIIITFRVIWKRKKVNFRCSATA